MGFDGRRLLSWDFTFMPPGELDLSRATLCYWHLMSRLTRNMLYFEPVDPQLTIDGTKLSRDQTKHRKY